MRLPVGDDGERTQVVRLPVGDDSERTQVVRLPVGDDEERTQVLRFPGPDAGERTQVVRLPVADDGERTQVVRLPLGDPTEKTQVVRLPVGDSGERTQVLRFPRTDGAEQTQPTTRSPGGETTQVLKFPGRPSDDRPLGPGERTRDLRNRSTDIGGDETQVIRMPGLAVEDEHTQVIRPGLVPPPGERTEPLGPRRPDRTQPPAPPAAGEAGNERRRAGCRGGGGWCGAGCEEAAPVSIAEAERPNFAEDPTSRIVPPGAVRDDEAERSMTVMKMERPPDEQIGERHPHRDIPAQRRPVEDD